MPCYIWLGFTDQEVIPSKSGKTKDFSFTYLQWPTSDCSLGVVIRCHRLSPDIQGRSVVQWFNVRLTTRNPAATPVNTSRARSVTAIRRTRSYSACKASLQLCLTSLVLPRANSLTTRLMYSRTETGPCQSTAEVSFLNTLFTCPHSHK